MSPSPSRRGDERGAVAILATVGVTVAIAACALAVDLGRSVFTMRSLQGIADLVALDSVRALGSDDPLAEAIELADKSALRNGFDPDSSGTMTVEVGHLDDSTHVFTATDPTTGLPFPDSVLVSLATSFDRSFTPGSTALSVTAAASQQGLSGFTLGSFVARLNTAEAEALNGVFNGLLGGNVNLTLVGYQGLAAGSVTLAELLATGNFSAGTVDELLDADVTLADLFSASAEVLSAKGDSASLTALTPLASLSSAVDSTLHLRLGDLIDVAQGSEDAAASANLRLFDLVGMAAQVANEHHFIDLTMPVTIPGVSQTRLRLTVIEPPRMAVGPARRDGDGNWMTRVETAQVRAQLDLTLVNKLLGLATVNLPVYLEAGGAEGALTAVGCSGDETITVETTTRMVESHIGSVGSSDLADVSSDVTVSAGQLVNLDTLLTDIRVTGSAEVGTSPTTTELEFDAPWDASNLQTVGGSSLGLGALLQGDLSLGISVLGVSSTLVQTSLLAILDPVLGSLDAELLNPLADALGLRLGGADVTANVPPVCQARRLAA